MQNNSNTSLVTYKTAQASTIMAGLVVAGLFAVYSIIVVFFTDDWPAQHVGTAYHFVIVVLTIIFVERENRRYQHVYHPFELGMFMWIFWPVYFPYYLVKSRGGRGLLVFLAVIALLLVESVVFLAWDMIYGYE